jgi:hypothetical protein
MENINLAIVEDDAVIRESLENFLAVVHILRYKFKRVIKIAGKRNKSERSYSKQKNRDFKIRHEFQS